MRILTITSLYPNKTDPTRGIFVHERIRRIAKMVERLDVIAPVGWFPLFRKTKDIPQKEEIDGITIYHPRFFSIPGIMKSLDGLFFYLGIRKTVAMLDRKNNYDLIDSHFAYPDGVGSAMAAKKFGKQHFLTVRGSDVNVLAHRFAGQVKESFRYTNKIFSVCEYLKNELICILGTDEEKIIVIRNGIEHDLFKPKDQKESRKTLQLNEEDKIIVSIGHIQRGKGYFELIRAIKNIKCKVLIIGKIAEANYKNMLDRFIAENKLEDRIVFVGSISHAKIVDYINAADICCLISKAEGIPNAVLEYMACGKPIVATAVGGTPEVVTQDVGILVNDPENITEIEDAIRNALAKEWDPIAIKNESAKYDWDNAAAEYLRVVKETLNIA